MVENIALETDAWLNLGIPGAALLIVLIVIMLIFKQQSENITKLCSKIDALVNSFTATNNTLNEVLINNNRDQQDIIRQMSEIHDELRDIHAKIVRVDARLYDHVKQQQEAKRHESSKTNTDTE